MKKIKKILYIVFLIINTIILFGCDKKNEDLDVSNTNIESINEKEMGELKNADKVENDIKKRVDDGVKNELKNLVENKNKDREIGEANKKQEKEEDIASIAVTYNKKGYVVNINKLKFDIKNAEILAENNIEDKMDEIDKKVSDLYEKKEIELKPIEDEYIEGKINIDEYIGKLQMISAKYNSEINILEENKHKLYEEPKMNIENCIVKLGRCEQDNNKFNGGEPIEWIVVNKKDGKALLVSRYALDSKQYMESEDSYCVDYYFSTIREWLNNDFYENIFNDEEKNIIINSKQYNSLDSYRVGEGIKQYPNPNTYDKIFLLNRYEIDENKANNIYHSSCYATKYVYSKWLIYDERTGSCWWWNRCDSRVNKTDVRDGYDNSYECSRTYSNGSNAVRPAMWVVYDENEFENSKKNVKVPNDTIKKIDLNYKILDDFAFARGKNLIDKIELKEKINSLEELPIVQFANIEWNILGKNENGVLLYSKNLLDKTNEEKGYIDKINKEDIEYNSNENNFKFIGYDQMFTRKIYNEYLYNSIFKEEDKKYILKTDVLENDRDVDYLFPLDIDTYVKYFNNDKQNNKCIGANIKEDDNLKKFAIRGNHSDDHCIAYLSENKIYFYDHEKINEDEIGLRPAMWISYEAINESNLFLPIEKKEIDFVEKINKIKNVKTFKECTYQNIPYETIVFGKYEQDGNEDEKDDIEWVVLDKNDDKALIMCYKIIEATEYSDNTLWENSKIRKWLNNKFYNDAFDDDEKDRIIDTNIDGMSDKIFILNKDEANQYILVDSFNKKYFLPESVPNIFKKYDTYYGSDSYFFRPIIEKNEDGSLLIDYLEIDNKEYIGFYGILPVMWVDIR